jgi:hypothetical protein
MRKQSSKSASLMNGSLPRKDGTADMTIEQFINEWRTEIDAIILDYCDNCQIDDDDEREEWILNLETLYLWAISEGVDI